MRYRTLGSGSPAVSELGFGASPLGGIYGTFAAGRPDSRQTAGRPLVRTRMSSDTASIRARCVKA